MAATGSGTQMDPYIVGNWDDFLTVCNISSTTYIVWDDAEDKVVDFNEINPQGFTETIAMKGIIDFNGWELRNFYSTAQIAFQLGNGYSEAAQSLSNLRITNARHDSQNTNQHEFIRIFTNDYSALDNVTISLEFSAENYSFIVTPGRKVTLNQFGSYVYGIANTSFVYTRSLSNYGSFDIKHSRLHMDVQDKSTVSSDSEHMFRMTTLYNSIVSGTYLRDGTGDGKLLIGTTASALNVIRLQTNKGVKYNGSGISLKIDRDYTGDIVRPNIATWDEHVLVVNETQSRTQQEEILAAGFPLHKAVD
jgi:hypothetical protein